MKSLNPKAVVATLLATLKISAAQNLVINGDFEQPAVPSGGYRTQIPNGWRSLGNGNTTDIIHEQYSGGTAAHGAQFLDLIGDPGTVFPSGLSQTIHLEAGVRYRLRFAYNGARYNDGSFTTNAVLEYSFGNFVSGAINVDALNVSPRTGPVTPWQILSTNFTATTSGDYVLTFQTRRGAFTSPFIDNVSVSVVSSSLSINVSEVRACWTTVPNVTYQLEYKSDPTTNVWEAVCPPIVGDGTTKCCFDRVVAGEPWKFYRVRELP